LKQSWNTPSGTAHNSISPTQQVPEQKRGHVTSLHYVLTFCSFYITSALYHTNFLSAIHSSAT